ncbi:MAG: hypothetical protein QM690_10835 [Sphingobium sp.]
MRGIRWPWAGRLDRAERTLAAQSAEDARDPARFIDIGPRQYRDRPCPLAPPR